MRKKSECLILFEYKLSMTNPKVWILHSSNTWLVLKLNLVRTIWQQTMFCSKPFLQKFAIASLWPVNDNQYYSQ
ncbi:hypothetical protein F0562_030150 [Nyssa sinensis]|uniref:Uncharacterized protein n=1 Tax=Nyssa sinensis TaxID=561372 RepID=A0A5J5B062_9ASTE|nr:hypothetical protein F0562_030150 [Nyssa sinensis]